MGDVVYGVFDDSMWELHLKVNLRGDEGFVKHVRCDDDNFKCLISRKVRECRDTKKGFRLYLDGALVHEYDPAC